MENLKQSLQDTLETKLNEVRDSFAMDIRRIDNKLKQLQDRMSYRTEMVMPNVTLNVLTQE